MRSCHSLRGSSTTSSRSSIRSVIFILPASFSVRLTCAESRCLSLSGALARACRTPLSAQLLCIRIRPARAAFCPAYFS